MVLNVLQEVLVGPSKLNLLDIPGFPYTEYEEQWSKYTEAERWFTGAALEDQPDSKAKVDLYPMRINPIIGTVLKHAYVLFGEVEDDARPLVIPKFIYNVKDKKSKVLAEEAEETINMLWWENNGRALLIENAMLSQIYGGCVFKATYVPWEDVKYNGLRSIPIRIERINPKNFIGTPDASDNYNLLEAWIVKEISKIEAQALGYSGDDELVWYVEHWTRTQFEITVDGKPAYRIMNGEQISMGGENVFGFIPIVYIPHVRVGDFKGFNAYNHLTGMVKELNSRWGDFGDAVNDDSHPTLAVRNVSGSVQIKRVNEWLEYVDLGANPGISGNEPEPDMFQVNQQRASTAMKSMIDGIMDQYRRDAFVPPVADGEDEGSQRSGLTLSIRFWPLTSHAGIERYFWTPGLDVFHRMLVRIMYIKKMASIKEEHTKMRIKEKWAPHLPRDREIEVNEWGVRSSNMLASIEHLIEMAGDVEDIPEERDRILQWIADLEDVKAQVTQKYALELQEATTEDEQELQGEQLESQQEVAKTQASAFQARAQQQKQAVKKPAAKRPPQSGGAK